MVSTVSGVFVPVDVLARDQGISEEEVVQRIQSGALVGRRQSDGWHVLVQVPRSQAEESREPSSPAPGAGDAESGEAPAAARGSTAAVVLEEPAELRGVVIKDVQLSLWTLVKLLVKCVFALIPACLLAYAIVLLVVDPERLIDAATMYYDHARAVIDALQ